MESLDNVATHNNDVYKKQDCLTIVRTRSNWEIDNNKNFGDCISTISIVQVPESTNLEDVVSLDTCIALKSDPSGESCRLEFKLTNNQRIARIAVVSEASVLEFFKQSGEYATTVFSEFVDDFQDHAVYFGEAKIQPPSTEAGIKFTRTKNKGTIWIYGIKLILTESESDGYKNAFNFDAINSYLSNVGYSKNERVDMGKKMMATFAASSNDPTNISTYIQQLDRLPTSPSENNDINHLNNSLECNGISTSQFPMEELKLYIDNKFANLEKILMEKLDLVNKKTNQKLDQILQKLESNILQE